jgi:hypothetical protein
MKSAYLNICRLIASSGYQERDIAAFVDELIKQGPNAVIGDIDDFRRLMKTPSSNRIFDTPTEQAVPLSDTALKIERLLINDAGMPKAVAVALLSDELRLRFPHLDVPRESRKGFYSWIRRLTALVPEKELLHIATSIRNRSVRDSPIDWRLK